ncbi:DUF4165 domain-containing protein [Salmonella enterica]|nr:DUF4165 domain-containing protein [Salmonella enterica]
MNRKIALLVAAVCSSATAHAEIAEYIFKDTLNVSKTVFPSQRWINPVTGFDVAVISGLDRYVTLTLLNSSGATLWSAKSSLVTVDDRKTSSTGFDYYGKTMTVPAMGEDIYTLREIITDLQGKEVSRRDYAVSIDRTPPSKGAISYTRGGWRFGSEAIFTPVPDGMQYAGVQAITFNGLADTGSGLSNAQYFMRDASGTVRTKSVEINKLTGTVTVHNTDAGGSAIAPAARAEYTMGLYVYDNAGNRAEMSRQTTIDRQHPGEIIQVLNTQTNQWENYRAGITVYTNPISVRVLRKKTDFVGVNGTKFGWADSNFQSSDAQYNIFKFNYVYPNNGNNYHEFETLAGAVRRVHHSDLKFTPAATMEHAPLVTEMNMYRSDTGDWGRSFSDKSIRISKFKVTAASRPYVQRISSNNNRSFFCLIPVGQTTCTMDVDFQFNQSGTGRSLTFLYIYTGKEGNPIYDTLNGNFTVTVDNNPPVINSASIQRTEKSITMSVTDPDRTNDWRINSWDTKIFGVNLRNSQGQGITLKAPGYSESDFQTKSATVSYATLPDGNYTVDSAFATDTFGNTATYKLNETLLLDSTAPAIGFTFNGADAEGKLVKGLENLRIGVTDVSNDAKLESLRLAGGPNSEKVTLAFSSLSNGVYVPEYPRIFPNNDESGQMYHLEAVAADGSGNRTTKTLNFYYQPANMIVLDNLRTLATAVALKTSDGTPLAFIKTSLLRRQDGSIITGSLTGTLTVQKDAQFGVTVAGVTVAPGETKSLTLDLLNGVERIYPVTPAISGASGSAMFAIEFPQVL